MYKKKVKSFIPVAGIDTLELRSTTPLQKKYDELPCVTQTWIHYKDTEQTSYTQFIYRVNPDKQYLGTVPSYSVLRQTLSEAVAEMGIDEFCITRQDLRLDFYTCSYDTLLKINRCLGLLFAISISKINRYHSDDPLSLDEKTIRFQNNSYQFEFYNKAIEEPESEISARLELRSTRLNRKNSLEDIVPYIKKWERRLNKLPDYYNQLQEEANYHLLKKWNEQKGNKVRSTWEFVRKYEYNFFTRTQLIKFFKQVCPEENEIQITRKVDNFKSRHKWFEFVTESNLREYVQILINALEKYIQE